MFGSLMHLFIFIVIVNLFSFTNCDIPSVVLCANPSCSEPISEGQGSVNYQPSEERVLGFKRGTKITILSKSKEKDGYWGAKIGNKFGFVPSMYVIEKIVRKSPEMLKHEVSTADMENNATAMEKENMPDDNVASNVVQKAPIVNTDPPFHGSVVSPTPHLVHGDHNAMSGLMKEPSQAGSLEITTAGVKPVPTTDPVHKASHVEGVRTPNTVNKNYENSDIGLIHDNIGEKHGSQYNIIEKPTGIFESAEIREMDVERSDSVTENNLEKSNNNDGENTIEINANTAAGNIQDTYNLGENSERSIQGSINTVSLSNTENLNTNNNTDFTIDSNKTYNDYNIQEVVENNNTINTKQTLVEFNEDILNATYTDGSDYSKTQDGKGISKLNREPDGGEDEGDEIDDDDDEDDGDDDNDEEDESEDTEVEEDVHKKSNIPSGTVPLKTENVDVSANISQNENLDSDGNTESIKTAHVDTIASSSNSISASSSSSGSSSSSSTTSSSSSSNSNSAGSGSVTVGNQKITDGGFRYPHLSTEHLSRGGIVSKPGEDKAPQYDHSPGMFVNQVKEAVGAGKEYSQPIPGNMQQMSNIIQEISLSSPAEANVELPITFSEKKDNSQEHAAGTTETAPLQNIHDRITEYIKYEPSNQPPLYIQPIHPVEGVPPNEEQKIPDSLNYEFSTQNSEYAPSAGVMDDSAQSSMKTSEEFKYETTTQVSDVPESVTEVPIDVTENHFPKNTNGDGLFSKIVSWVGLGSQTSDREIHSERDAILEDALHNNPTSPPPQIQKGSDEVCTIGDSSNCEGITNVEEDSKLSWNFWSDRNVDSATSYNTFIYLVVTAITVLLFTLGYYFIEKLRNDGPLIAKVNRLEQELLVSSKECLILKDELANTKEKLGLFETSSNDKIITALQLELEESKKIRLELESNIEVLQQELDAATEAGLDLNRMLSEVLTQKGGSETLMESVEHLQAQLNNQQKIIDEMTTKLIAKTNENQGLQDELMAANEKIEILESEIDDIKGNLNVHLKDNEDAISDLTSKNNELQLKINQLNEVKEKEILRLKKMVSDWEKKSKATSDSLKVKEEECNNLKDSIKKIKMKDGKNVDSLFEVSRIKAELHQYKSDNESVKVRLKAEEEKYEKLETKFKKMEEEMEKLKLISCEAEKEKVEAQTRLEVLSNYFKEKETQLQKELGLKEAMWVQKQGDDSTVIERMKSLEEEVGSYKSQNEALKAEILDQERGLKAQITALEKKAHENWIAARQAERKLEESKQEAAQLRNKITLMDKNISNDLESSHRVNEDLNGGDTLSPLIHDTSSPIIFPPPLPLDPSNTSLMPPGFIPPPMFMPPPPGGFMPPPPPFLPGDHRPPPLGRMSSPPLNNRFSPPLPDYAYDPPLSPSTRNYRSPTESDRDRERFRHRTPTSPSFRSRNWEEGSSVGMSGFRPILNERDNRRENKGGSNLSSGHSSDSLDKSSRHSGRV